MTKKKENPAKRGRKPKYTEAEIMQTAIDAYFNSLPDGKMPTVSGLALALGFEDRQSLYDYAGNPEFSCTLKKAILRVADRVEELLLSGGGGTGAIFWLKNHGWKDKTEADVNVKEYSLFEEEVRKKSEKWQNEKTK